MLNSLYNVEESVIKDTVEASIKNQNELIRELEEDIDKAKHIISTKEKVLLGYTEFLQLFEDMANIIAKTKKEEELNELVGKMFSNFLVDGKNVLEYTLNPPFDALETKQVTEVTDGGR